MNSAANRYGRDAQRDLNRIRRCYYWFFRDDSLESVEDRTTCPACGQPLVDYTANPDHKICEPCSIVL